MGNDENFDFLGLPNNEAFDIPDPAKKRRKPNSGPMGMGLNIDPSMLEHFSKMSPEEIKANIPPEIYQSLEGIAKMLGSDLNELLGDMKQAAQDMADEENDENLEDEEEKLQKYDSTGNLRFLDPASFGSIKCQKNVDFHSNLYMVIEGNEKNLIPLITAINKEIVKDLPLTEIKNLKYVGSCNTHDIFFTEMSDPNQYGFFVSIYQDEEGNYKALIPVFRNTFWIDENDKPHLYNINKEDKDNDLDEFDENQITKELTFNGTSSDIIDFATRFQLAPIDVNHIITATEFGTIKNVMPVIPKANSILKVGNIVPFSSDKSKTFMADANLNESDAPFPLYINFGTIIEKESLGEIAQIFFKINLNECPLVQNAELHYTPDGIIYINVDLGQF